MGGTGLGPHPGLLRTRHVLSLHFSFPICRVELGKPGGRQLGELQDVRASLWAPRWGPGKAAVMPRHRPGRSPRTTSRRVPASAGAPWSEQGP